jgi:hypothetical protein
MPQFGKLFRFYRFDIKLEEQWLTENMGAPPKDYDIVKLRQMENPENIPVLYNFGRIAAQRQITHAMFEKFL